MAKSDDQETRATAHFVLGAPWALSIALHAFLIGGFGWLAFRSIHTREVEAAAAHARLIDAPTIAVELPGVSEGTLFAEQPPDRKGDPPQYFGGTTTAQSDWVMTLLSSVTAPFRANDSRRLRTSPQIRKSPRWWNNSCLLDRSLSK